MNSIDHESRHLLAWNGIRLLAPRQWEFTRLDRYYARAAGDDEAMAFECKWQQGKGIGTKKALVRLSRAFKGRDLTMGDKALPHAVRRAFQELAARGFGVHPFSWRSEGALVAGALLECGVCGRSSLVQCVSVDTNPQLAAGLIASFRDHLDDGGAQFALFGIQANIPSGFTLGRFSFKPGQYRLEFTGDKTRKRAGLVLERVGPADVLYGGKGFTRWAAERFAQAGADRAPREGTWRNGPSLEWKPEKTGAWDHVAHLLSRRRVAQVRVWQPGVANMVLCVALSGGGEEAGVLFEEVCAGYVLS